MSQQMVIRLIPVNVLLVCLIVGWAAVVGIQGLLGDTRVAQAAAPAAANAAADAAPAALPAGLSPVFSPEVLHWADQIMNWAAQYQLDPNLIATVMQIESCGAPGVVSSSGAQGLFQVMPFHFAAGENMQDPETNAMRGMNYLALGLARANGDAGLAMAGYNGGHSQIGKDSSLWPNQTQRYYYWGTGIYQDAVSGQTSSARLQEWLQAGGASLCARAAEQIGLPR
jgi:soluble lytic murein transglycosylase-like protein